jgi:hypothetical protein
LARFCWLSFELAFLLLPFDFPEALDPALFFPCLGNALSD